MHQIDETVVDLNSPYPRHPACADMLEVDHCRQDRTPKVHRRSPEAPKPVIDTLRVLPIEQPRDCCLRQINDVRGCGSGCIKDCVPELQVSPGDTLSLDSCTG